MAAWCCMCGAEDPAPMEVCPVSAHKMAPATGLRHLLAQSRHERALAIYNGSAAQTREALAAKR